MIFSSSSVFKHREEIAIRIGHPRAGIAADTASVLRERARNAIAMGSYAQGMRSPILGLAAPN